MRVGLAVATVAAFVLAGCAGSAGSGSTTSGALASLDAKHVEVSGGQGAIKGVVVDDAIRPIPKATVTLRGAGAAVLTDASGQFVFSSLQPGTYFLAVNASRFLPTQTSAVVEAGQVASVRVLLPGDPSPTPYHETVKFDGFIGQSVPLASYALDIVTSDELNQSSCQCLQVINTGPATTIVFEMVWTPTSAPPTGDEDLYYQFYEHSCSCSIHIESEFVTSPYLKHWERQDLWGNTTLFEAHYGGSSTWVDLNQDFTSYITMWYAGKAPKDWSFVKGDA